MDINGCIHLEVAWTKDVNNVSTSRSTHKKQHLEVGVGAGGQTALRPTGHGQIPLKCCHGHNTLGSPKPQSFSSSLKLSLNFKSQFKFRGETFF